MKIIHLVSALLCLAACSGEDEHECHEGEAQCVGDSQIQTCSDEAWGAVEDCPEMQVCMVHGDMPAMCMSMGMDDTGMGDDGDM